MANQESYLPETKEVCNGGVACSNQIRVVAFNVPQLTQASLLQKKKLQNVFLLSVTLRWHRASVACKNQSFKS